MSEERKIFSEVVQGRNHLTPWFVHYGRSLDKNIIYELTEGAAMDLSPMYGVTVIRFAEGKWSKADDLSKCLFLREEYERLLKGD